MCGVLILLSTFMPPGAWSLNPTPDGLEGNGDEDDDEEAEEGEAEEGRGKALVGSGIDETLFYTPASSTETAEEKQRRHRRRQRRQYVCFGPEVHPRRYTAENALYRLWVTPI